MKKIVNNAQENKQTKKIIIRETNSDYGKKGNLKIFTFQKQMF